MYEQILRYLKKETLFTYRWIQLYSLDAVILSVITRHFLLFLCGDINGDGDHHNRLVKVVFLL